MIKVFCLYNPVHLETSFDALLLSKTYIFVLEMFSNPNMLRFQSQGHKNGGISNVVSQTCYVQNPATSWISKANVPSEAKDTTETYKMSETSGNFVQNAECRGRLST